MNITHKMSTKPIISPRILPNISTIYNNPNKILMEYIDNSLDSAEFYFDKQRNAYKKEIEITLKITGKSEKDGKIEIYDNCTGINDITKLVSSIGNSDKKAQSFTNGQFGYGVYSFMATCNTLEVLTKYFSDSHGYYIPIYREQFYVDSADDIIIPDPKEIQFPLASGTTIRLSEFDKGTWRGINHNEIMKEINEHFEILLLRKYLTIKLIDQSGNEYYCNPFNYDEIEGHTEYQEIEKLEQISTRGNSSLKSIFPLESPIKIFIKITDDKIINKPPLFFIKGRSIGKVGEIFKRSKHKADIWSHPNITGYIDLAYNIEPTLARTDLKNDIKTRALFNFIENSLEPKLADIMKFIKESNETRHYQSLENELNKALAELAKLDSLSFRTEIVTGDGTSLNTGSEGSSFEIGHGTKDRAEGSAGGPPNPNPMGENEGDSFGPIDNLGPLPGEKGKGDSPIKDEENPFADNSGGERKKSGFNIKILEQQPPTINSEPLRSQYIDGNIIIYREHPDFLERVDSTSRRGDSRISQRLVTYLAGEITVHYKDILQTRNGQPEYNKDLFVNLVEFIYQFESMLVGLVGRNLSDLGGENES